MEELVILFNVLAKSLLLRNVIKPDIITISFFVIYEKKISKVTEQF